MAQHPPCKDCDERHLYCHGECRKYQEWADEVRKQTPIKTEGEKYEAARRAKTFMEWVKRKRR